MCSSDLVEAQFRASGFRIDTDTRSTKVNAKIRDAQLDLIPYMLVVGPKDQEAGAVSIRDRIGGKDLGMLPLGEALAMLQKEATERAVRQVVKSKFRSFDQDQGEMFAE